MNLLIYTPKITARSKYVFEQIVGEYFGVLIEITCDKAHFVKSTLPRINYSDSHVEAVINVVPQGLLESGGIVDKVPDVLIEDDRFYLYPGDGDLKADIFSGIFYLLSRYEEYVIEDRDQHNRFKPQNSILFKHGFLQKPVVDIWLDILASKLTAMYPSFNRTKPDFEALLTLDIDNGYAYLGKGFFRNLGGLSRDLLKGNIGLIRNRIKVLLGKQKDPYDHYDYLSTTLKTHPVNLKCFVPTGRRSRFDKNLPPGSKIYQDLIKKLADMGEIGIHPSYASNSNSEILSEEVERLSRVLEAPIKMSRQHYLKLQIPATYQNLLKLGIKHDFTMGYAQEPGFRSGTGRSFMFYDLSAETITDLRIHPFAYMDGTFRDYKQISADEAKVEITHLISEMKLYGGCFIWIWHNDSISNSGKWHGWRDVFEHTLKSVYED